MYLAKNIEESMIESVVDGDGFRLVVFTCGCPHHCPDCQNKSTWNKSAGINYSINDIFSFISTHLNTGYFNGITFSGGDPLFQEKELNELIILIKNNYSSLNVWVYTGYLYEEVKNMDVIKNIDVLIDGKFDKDKIYPKKKYRGSYNQRILHLKNGIIQFEE